MAVGCEVCFRWAGRVRQRFCAVLGQTSSPVAELVDRQKGPGPWSLLPGRARLCWGPGGARGRWIRFALRAQVGIPIEVQLLRGPETLGRPALALDLSFQNP